VHSVVKYFFHPKDTKDTKFSSAKICELNLRQSARNNTREAQKQTNMPEKELQAFDEYDYPFLDEPIPVTEQCWPEDVPPLVSVSCKTFMHENFIRDAIEGFLMQKTTFRVEVLIHDDASTDKTADIVREYEAKHPQLIKTTYQVENQYKKKPKTDKYVKPHPRRGKYIAPCEGDDYWTDPLKLQKQVEFMEKNPDYVMCYHKNQQRRGDVLLPKKIPAIGRDFTGDELVATPAGIATATKLFRNVFRAKNRPPRPSGDYGLNAYLGTYGRCKFLSGIKPSVRRLHEGGVWSSKSSNDKYYGIVSTKISMYRYFRKQQDEHRANVCLVALADAIEESLFLLEPKQRSFKISKERLRLIFHWIKIDVYYKPLLLLLRRKAFWLVGKK